MAIEQEPGPRDVHAEHRLIFEMAMAGQEARAAMALKAQIRATPDLPTRSEWASRQAA
ncbi:MAG TPA: hypothetical protein VFP68_21485 [Burkholderiaceae bacterium]|nr:hypothetical protein [Burkholderiaceae bacterium]